VTLGYLIASAAGEGPDLKAAITKLAVALEKNDKEAAKKLIDELKKEDLEYVMELMKPPKSNKQAFDFTKEGIELKLTLMVKKPGDLKTNAETYEKMANVLTAIAEYTTFKCPIEKPVGAKDPKDWEKWSADMKEGAKALGAAARAKDPKKVSVAAKKITGACVSCHEVFRQ
jgi:hypothetical protein